MDPERFGVYLGAGEGQQDFDAFSHMMIAALNNEQAELDLAEFMNNRKLFNDKDELESSMFNYINLKKEKQESPSNNKVDLSDFEDEILKITYKDYYFSNVIARSSKTMLNCNNSKLEVKRTGTEG